MEIAKDKSKTDSKVARMLALSDISMETAMEVLPLRAQYFRDICENGI